MSEFLLNFLSSQPVRVYFERVGINNVPDLILHIAACRVLCKEDIFTFVLYHWWNRIPLEWGFSILENNPFYNGLLMYRFYDVYEYLEQYFHLHVHEYFTYDISRGGVYYLDGRKKVTYNRIDFDDCDVNLIYEFFYNDFEWHEYRLAYDNYNNIVQWRYNRPLPVGWQWVIRPDVPAVE